MRSFQSLAVDELPEAYWHGGITEIGDAGKADARAIPGDKTLNTTANYNKASDAKAVRIATARRQHIGLLGAKDD